MPHQDQRHAGLLLPSVFLALAFLIFMLEPACAEEAVKAKPNAGDSAWVMISTALVLMMAIPGLALFYGGLVRAKNMLSVLTHVFVIVAIVSILWVTYGYSLAFTSGGSLNAMIGGLSKAFLRGVEPSSIAATFSNGVVIPEYAYIAFQMTFACITPAIIVGAFAERVKFPSLLIFVVVWVTLVYLPIAHMVWYWSGPDAIAAAARAVRAATGDAERASAITALEAVKQDAGLLFQWGALDFAGGTVVHINAGIAGLVGAIIIGKRIGYGREAMAPHSLTMTMIGASLLWVGWAGFNAGSALEANGTAALAIINTFVAAGAGTLGWLGIEWLLKGKPSLLGGVSGAVSGLVVITPASGFAGPMGAIILGFIGGIACFGFVSELKNRLGFDDSLDVFGIHGIGGIIGGLGTALVVNPALGGTGLADYEINPGELVLAAYAFWPLLFAQIKAVGFTIMWSAAGSALIFRALDLTLGLRVSRDEEREGLDLAAHGERAYNT